MDRFVIGQGSDTGRRYIVHLRFPRFAAFLDTTSDDPAAIDLGDGRVLHGLVWLDNDLPITEPPDDPEILRAICSGIRDLTS